MSFIRSLQASAAFLSFCTVSQAWVLHRKNDAHVQNEINVAPIELRANSFEKRQDTVLDCSENRFQDLLDSNPADRVMTFCNEWLGIAPATVVEQVTPTITITTSASTTTTVTSTDRTIVTQTTTKFATTTIPPVTLSAGVQARAANVVAVAEDIIASVIVSGTDSQPTSTQNDQRQQAASGLANACSCKMVDPTATVTSSFTVPPVYTTVGARRLVIARVTETRSFTTVTTVTETPAPVTANSTSSVAQSSTAAASNETDSSSGSAVESITAAPTVTRLSTGVPLTNASSTGSSAPVVTAIPFSCPVDSNKRADQIVDDFRFEYLVLCNTEIITRDRIGTPITTDDQNSCTAQCSVLNSESGQATCQAATFTAFTDGRKGGTCVLSGKDTEYAEKPGAISVVNTGISSNGDECAAIDAIANATKSVDTSALVASITSAGISISTPGLITQAADGGVFETYVSANSTDASGYIHWSWYRVSASSSYWWAVYGTSWACTRTITQTIVQQPPTTANPETIISTALETTIINGDTTTIISGSSTRTIVGGGGVIPPTFVPASVTSDDGGITTFFSAATATSTGNSGLIPPTAVPGNATVSRGSIEISVSFATSTFFSTMSEGIITPSASPSPSANVTEVVSSNGTQIASSGSIYILESTGDSGIIPPATTNGSAVFSTSTATTTVTSTRDAGGYGPPPSTTDWTYPNVTSGAANFTIEGSTAVVDSTGMSGVIAPSPTASGSNVTVASSTFTANSTGSEGVIPPATTTPSNVTATSGSGSFSTYDSNSTYFSTGDSGIIPPASTVSDLANATSTGGIGIFTIQESTGTFTSTGDSGIITPFANSSITNPPSGSPTPSLNGSTTDTFSNTDVNRSRFPLPSSSTANFTVPSNSSMTSPPSGTPTNSLNISTTDTFSNSEIDRSRFPLPSSSTSNDSIIIVTITTTTTLPTPSATEPPFGNSTVPTGTGFTIASISIPSPSLNSTVTPTPWYGNSTIPSLTPTMSLNSSMPTLCPTAPVTVTETEVSVSTQVVTTTVLQIQTVTVDSAASSSGSPASSPASPASSSDAPVSAEAAASSSRPVNDAVAARTAGEPATQEQIDAACAGSGNIVVNPDFNKRADATVPGWSVDASDPNVTVDSVDDQAGNSTTARFSSAVAGSPLTITQALTLCPGQQYSLSARTRQANELAACNVEFVISSGDQQKSVLKVTPQTSETTKSAFFTAGSSNADAAVDLKITAKCDGYQGFPVSDDEGWMRVEVGGVSVSKDA